MSFLKNLFGNSNDKSDEKSPIQVIEEELGILFPSRFKQFLSDKLPKDNSIEIQLLDGPYKFLDALFNKDVTNNYESVISISNDLNSDLYPEEKELVKIPFAKSTEGDGFKYLYFVAEKQKEASEKILLRDLDSPGTGRIPLCNQLPFIFRSVGKVKDQTIITNTSLNFSEANTWIEIPEYVNIWKDSYGANVRDEARENNCMIDLYLTNYKMEDKNENFSKIEVQVDMTYQNKRILAANAFEVDKSGLQIQFVNNINYRIFYHKFVCLIGTLAMLAGDLKNNHNIEIIEFLNTLNLGEFVKQNFKGIEEQNA